MKYAPVLRQVLIVTGLAFCSFSDGFIFGQMSGMINDLSKKENIINITEDDISWIASTMNITCFCGIGIMTILTEILGRRKPITIITTPVLISWILVYFAQEKYIILLTRIIVGVSYGGILVLGFLNVGEYIAPSARSLCLNLTAASGSFGTLLGHILSLIIHWRYVALIGIVPTVISAILPLFWVESPFWLATKGRFEECERTFKAIRNSNIATERELKKLIIDQKLTTNNGRVSKKSNVFLFCLNKYRKMCKERFYRKICLLVTVVNIYRVAAGRILLNTFIITLIQDITNTSDIVLYTLLVDGLTLVGGCLSCLFVSRYRMRVLLFTSGPMANIIQVILAFYLYLYPDNTVYVTWTKVSLLAFYSVLISVGPYAVLETLLSELHPLDVKAMSSFTMAGIAGVIQFISIKLAPNMFSVIGYHGVFFCNAVIVFICLFYLYFYLPETKGRSLQEIQFYFIDNKYSERMDSNCSEQQNVLLSEEGKKTERDLPNDQLPE